MKELSNIVKIGECTQNIDEILAMCEEHYDDDTRRQDGFHETHKDTRSVLLKLNWDYKDRHNNMPLHDKFRPLLSPLMDTLREYYGFDNFAYWKAIIVSLEPKGMVKRHTDNHDSFDKTHRCHWILKTNDKVIFKIGKEYMPAIAGSVFQIDNVTEEHSVINSGNEHRHHLIIDVYDDDDEEKE